MNKKFINGIIIAGAIGILLLSGATEYVFGQQYFGEDQGAGAASPYQQAPPADSANKSLVLQGLEGLKGFGSGHNQLTLAVIPVSQKGDQMTFQVAGFAVSSPESGEAVVYSLATPLNGIIDTSRNTLQIDIANLDSAISTVGYIDSSLIYDTMRSDPQVVLLDVDLAYQGKQDSQAIFSVNAIDMVSADGKMQTFSMEQPTQLVIDKQSDRVATVAFPEMANAFGGYYGVTYPQVDPVVYSAPVPVLAPVFIPYVRPIPIFYTGFVHYNTFRYGTGFRRFYDRDIVTGRDRFTSGNRYPIRQPRNDYADRARNNLVSGQRRGEFTQSRNAGRGITGGIGGYRGGARASVGGRVGGGRAGGRRR